ncbi:MAG: hypothetical protein KDA49_11520 [Rhodospirillaceae bacterium]|nr:hypothetical protein [Rhodospirillaceae bacterium]MCA8933090.1 hypothetical protein [Rhodospirillaceae bacterium]
MVATLLQIAEIYLWIGAAVAAVFLVWGIDRVEPNAAGAYVFRPLLIPGILLLWPLVLWRCWVLVRGENEACRHRPPRRAQHAVAIVLALAIPVILMGALLVRQNRPLERPAELLAPPAEAPAAAPAAPVAPEAAEGEAGQ